MRSARRAGILAGMRWPNCAGRGLRLTLFPALPQLRSVANGGPRHKIGICQARPKRPRICREVTMAGVKRERHGAVALLTLDEPATLNAMTPDLLGDLAAAVRETTADSAVRAL